MARRCCWLRYRFSVRSHPTFAADSPACFDSSPVQYVCIELCSSSAISRHGSSPLGSFAHWLTTASASSKRPSSSVWPSPPWCSASHLLRSSALPVIAALKSSSFAGTPGLMRKCTRPICRRIETISSSGMRRRHQASGVQTCTTGCASYGSLSACWSRTTSAR